MDSPEKGDPVSAMLPLSGLAQQSGPGVGVPANEAIPDSAGRRRRSRSGGLLPLLVGWDALVPAAVIAIGSRFDGFLGDPLGGTDADFALALALGALAPLVLAATGAYGERLRWARYDMALLARLAMAALALSWLSLVLTEVAETPVDAAGILASTLLLPVGWLIGRLVIAHHPSLGPERVLLLGSGVVAGRVLEFTGRRDGRRLKVIGRLDGATRADDDQGPPILGDLDDLPVVLASHDIDRVVVAFTPIPDSELVDALRRCVATGVQVDVVPRFFELVGLAPRARSLCGISLIEVPARGLTTGQRLAKRCLDVLGAAALLTLFSPLIATIAAALLVLDGRPIIFRQVREGQGGRPFSMLKFRTMRPDSEPVALVGHGHAAAGELIDGHKQGAAARVTPVGRFLRRMSMDELPQLWNVLRGDMSLVGPRPIPLYESELLLGWHHGRHDLRPGLTGLWQVSGRSDITWDERMQLDYTYVAHWSLASDLAILARTLPAVLRKDGAV